MCRPPHIFGWGSSQRIRFRPEAVVSAPRSWCSSWQNLHRSNSCPRRISGICCQWPEDRFATDRHLSKLLSKRISPPNNSCKQCLVDCRPCSPKQGHMARRAAPHWHTFPHCSHQSSVCKHHHPKSEICDMPCSCCRCRSISSNWNRRLCKCAVHLALSRTASLGSFHGIGRRPKAVEFHRRCKCSQRYS